MASRARGGPAACTGRRSSGARTWRCAAPADKLTGPRR
eukprot:CAMPEP_0170301348 /NCGR_PEP_ID=MMETSP0116_2-20130129/50933_1 /TAXON_ID=400756 /ORGANISM="Durinskia baltica, Strain CSIRO CS-38" /LENGTH=37 /DNA_ID= /DNA_START= /DNA_END= /DNA_ORIENTATION=